MVGLGSVGRHWTEQKKIGVFPAVLVTGGLTPLSHAGASTNPTGELNDLARRFSSPSDY